MTKRRIALWWFAVVPATLCGHVVAYACSGRASGDPRHAYLVPLLDLSLLLLTAMLGAAAISALLRARRVQLDLGEGLLQSAARLAPLQLLLYTALEHGEGHTLTSAGFVAQLFAAAIAALVLSLASHLLATCERSSERAAAFVERLHTAETALFVRRTAVAPAYALAARAGVARFQRPPPATF